MVLSFGGWFKRYVIMCFQFVLRVRDLFRVCFGFCLRLRLKSVCGWFSTYFGLLSRLLRVGSGPFLPGLKSI